MVDSTAGKIGLCDLNIYDVGNGIQLYGAIYAGKGQVFLLPLPDENPDDLSTEAVKILVLTAEEMERFFHQTDVLDTQGPGKVILRKSQRQIDQNIAWQVFRRDGYGCRYCGRVDVPLTVDHVIVWEDGGASVAQNLVSACRRCNKLRGNTDYATWLRSGAYQKVSRDLPERGRVLNADLLSQLEYLKQIETKPRSR
jgi:hypothetical protein